MVNQIQPRRMLVQDLDEQQRRDPGCDGQRDGVGVHTHQPLGQHRVGITRPPATTQVGDKRHQGPTQGEVHENQV